MKPSPAATGHRTCKLINALLIVTSLLGYLEWSGDSSGFLFQMEGEVLAQLVSAPGAVIHPFILVIGMLAMNYKIAGSALPFLGVALWRIVRRQPAAV